MPVKTEKRRRLHRCAKKQKWICFYCQVTLRDGSGIIDLDHVFPRFRRNARAALGGLPNLVAVHRRCNLAKGRRLPTEDELRRFSEIYEVPLDGLLVALDVGRQSQQAADYESKKWLACIAANSATV